MSDVLMCWTDLMDMHRQASTATSLSLTRMSLYFFPFPSVIIHRRPIFYTFLHLFSLFSCCKNKYRLFLLHSHYFSPSSLFIFLEHCSVSCVLRWLAWMEWIACLQTRLKIWFLSLIALIWLITMDGLACLDQYFMQIFYVQIGEA